MRLGSVLLHASRPFEEFIHRQSTGGLLLMDTAIIALLLANSSLADAYLNFILIPTSLNIGAWEISLAKFCLTCMVEFPILRS